MIYDVSSLLNHFSFSHTLMFQHLLNVVISGARCAFNEKIAINLLCWLVYIHLPSSNNVCKCSFSFLHFQWKRKMDVHVLFILHFLFYILIGNGK